MMRTRRDRSSARSARYRRMPATEGGAVGTSKTSAPSASDRAALTSAWWSMPSAAGRPTRAPSAVPMADRSAAATLARWSGCSSARASPSDEASASPRTSTVASAERVCTDTTAAAATLAATREGKKSRRACTLANTTAPPERRSPAAIAAGATAVGRTAPSAVARSRFSSPLPRMSRAGSRSASQRAEAVTRSRPSSE